MVDSFQKGILDYMGDVADFNFDDPDFYSKFVRGKLMYFLSQQSFPDFLYEYAYFKRGVTEQVLQLTSKEKKEIQLILFENVNISFLVEKPDITVK